MERIPRKGKSVYIKDESLFLSGFNHSEVKSIQSALRMHYDGRITVTKHGEESSVHTISLIEVNRQRSKERARQGKPREELRLGNLKDFITGIMLV